jgi:hypothetical protein
MKYLLAVFERRNTKDVFSKDAITEIKYKTNVTTLMKYTEILVYHVTFMFKV